jgi:hypothetical protein
METTIASIADATRRIRVGGMISVITVTTNASEYEAVHLFMEGLGLLSARNYQERWDEVLSTTRTGKPTCNTTTSSADAPVVATVRNALQQVAASSKGCSWRVVQHKIMGRPQSPVLITAVRIK